MVKPSHKHFDPKYFTLNRGHRKLSLIINFFTVTTNGLKLHPVICPELVNPNPEINGRNKKFSGTDCEKV